MVFIVCCYFFCCLIEFIILSRAAEIVNYDMIYDQIKRAARESRTTNHQRKDRLVVFLCGKLPAAVNKFPHITKKTHIVSTKGYGLTNHIIFSYSKIELIKK